MWLECGRESGSTSETRGHIVEDLLKELALDFGRDCLQRLQHWDASLDEDGQLAGEMHQVPALDPSRCDLELQDALKPGVLDRLGDRLVLCRSFERADSSAGKLGLVR